MAKRPLLILHGWSGESKHLKQLSNFLKSTDKFKVVDVWLSDYLSLNDEIAIHDLGQAMGKAIKANDIPENSHSFDVIVHSTGGLVIRQYLIHYFYGAPKKCPIKNLVMLAPANIGSPLAHVGKSMLGRLKLGWNWDHFWQTGTKVLNALELGSPISWKMAEEDLFNPENRIFTPDNIFTTVLIGSDSYTGLGEIMHENGSDGTVRVSTANLNASYIKLVFSHPNGYEVIEKKPCYKQIAFGVLYGQNHGSIIRPKAKSDDQLKEVLMKSLTIGSPAEYENHIKYLDGLTKSTFQKGMAEQNKEKRYHQYQHVVTRVRDQFGEDIKDYFIEFFQEEDIKTDNVMEKVHKEILEKVHAYSNNSSYRSFLFDITDMRKEILDNGKRVDMSLCAAALSKNIYYHDPKEYLTVVSNKGGVLLKENTTLFVDIILPRIQDKKVFQFKKV